MGTRQRLHRERAWPPSQGNHRRLRSRQRQVVSKLCHFRLNRGWDELSSSHPLFLFPFTASALPLAAAPRALRAPATFAPFRPRRPAPSGFLQPFTAPSVKRLRLCRGEGARGG